MSKFQGKFDIVSTDLRIILLNFVATDVYVIFKKSIKKNLHHNVQNEGGGGGEGRTMFKKTADLVEGGSPYHPEKTMSNLS